MEICREFLNMQKGMVDSWNAKRNELEFQEMKLKQDTLAAENERLRMADTIASHTVPSHAVSQGYIPGVQVSATCPASKPPGGAHSSSFKELASGGCIMACACCMQYVRMS